MDLNNGELVEVGYAIPALYVSPPLHDERLINAKSQAYMLVVVEQNRERYTVNGTYSNFSTFQKQVALAGTKRYYTQVSIGVTSGNANLLDFQRDLVPASESQWLVLKEALRVTGGQIQLVVFNDGDEVITISGYQIVTGDVSGRIRSEL